jgi:predicted permease
MAQPCAFLSRVRSLLRKRRIDAALDEELRAHVEMLAEDYVRGGMTPDEARRKARLRLGGIEQTKEAVRDARGTFLDSVWQDVRFALRTFRRTPAFTAVAIVTLALAIGINSTIFSLADGVLFRPLPYRAPDRLVSLTASNVRYQPPHALSPADVRDLRSLNHTCEDIAAMGSLAGYRVKTGEVTELVNGMQASRNFFAVLGVQPLLGRTFSESELRPGAERVAIISSRLWRSRFGGDLHVLGRNLDNARGFPLFRVIGVLPDSFQFPTLAGHPVPDVVRPLITTPAEDYQAILHPIARLKPGITVPGAAADLTAIARRLMPERPGDRTSAMGPVDTVIVQPLHAELTKGSRTTALALFAAVSALLLIATVNLANLLLARGADRRRELAVRAALGAGRARLARQMLTESVHISLAGGAMGLLLATWLLALVGPLVPERLHLLKEVGIDVRLLAYTTLVSIVAAAVFGTAPALRFSRPEVGATLAAGPLRPFARRRIHSALVFVEVALVLIVLAGGGLVVNSFLRLKLLDTGYQPHGVTALRIYTEPAMLDQVLAGIRAIPGVRSVGAANETLLNIGWPLLGREMKRTSFAVDGSAVAEARSTDIVATAGYFETMGIQLLKGRLFTERDSTDNARVAIVSESMARGFGVGVDPIGRRLRDTRNGRDVRDVVGVVADVRDHALDDAPEATVYTPFEKSFSDYMTLVIRADAGTDAVRRQAIEQIRRVDRTAAIDGVGTLDELLDRSVAERSFNTLLFAAFAITALGLCAAGVYGVVSYAVARRTHEIGVRVALGAAHRHVVRMIVKQALVPVLAGIAVGLLGAVAATKFIGSLLFEVKPTDPLTFAAVSVILFGAALTAAYLPARRATRIDPMAALRCE